MLGLFIKLIINVIKFKSLAGFPVQYFHHLFIYLDEFFFVTFAALFHYFINYFISFTIYPTLTVNITLFSIHCINSFTSALIV